MPQRSAASQRAIRAAAIESLGDRLQGANRAVRRVARPRVSSAADAALQASVLETLESRLLLSRATGIDVSHYQGSINWTSVKNSGLNYAYMQASDGMSDRDASFAGYVSGAAAAGMTVGFYHFAYYSLAGHTPLSEANNFWNAIKNDISADGKHLMPMLDIEEGSALGSGTGETSLTQWVKDWCTDIINDAAAISLRVVPIVYTSSGNINAEFDTTIPQKIPLWVADYTGTTSPQTDEPTAGTGRWQTWQMWQYKSTGSVSGISGNVDMDVLNGDTNPLKDYIVSATSASANGWWPANSIVQTTTAINCYATLADAQQQTSNFTGVASGVTGTVLSGPNYGGSYQRYHVTFTNGVSGWCGEDFMQTATPAVATNPNPANSTTVPINTLPTNFTWTAGANTSSYQVYLDSVLQATVTGTSWAHGTIAAGAHTWHVNSLNAELSTTGTTWHFTLDTTAPTVSSINRVGATPTNAASVSWTVTFSETVTGVDTTDFSLANVGMTGAAITGVTGSGATRTVTASTGSGTGSLGLNLVDNDSITDTAGNKLGGTGSGNGNFTGQVFTTDTVPPTVSSINRVSTSPINAPSVSWTVVFSESVTGVDLTDFSLAVSGLTGTSLSTISGSGTTYTVTANTGSGSGTIGLNLADNDSIVDSVGNKLGGTGTGNGNFTGQVYSIDRTAPQQPATPVLDPSTDSGAVGDNTTNFTQPKFTGAAGATEGNATVTVFDGTTNLGTTPSAADGSWSFTVPPAKAFAEGSHSITISTTDSLNNTSVPSAPLAIMVDTTPPSLLSINRAGGIPTNAASVDFTVAFNESVTSVDASDFTLTTSGITGASISNVVGSGSSWTISVATGSGDGTVRLDLVGSATITDVAGNLIGAAGFTSGQSYTIDKTAPSVLSINLNDATPTNASTVHWSVVFSEPVTGVDATDFSFAGTLGTASITSVSGSGTTYTVTADTGTGSGTLGLNLVDDDSIVDVAGNALGGAGAGNGNFTGQTYSIDKTPPSATFGGQTPAVGNATFDFTITYTDTGSGLDASTFDSSDVTVTGPNNLSVNATFVSVDTASNGSPRTVTYRISAPGGSWNVADGGTYTVAQNSGQVLDLATNAAPAGTLGTFDFSAPFAYVSGTTLHIDYGATDTSVDINSDQSGNIVASEATSLSFDPTTFNNIVVQGTSGSEGVVISTALVKPLTFDGQGGNDTITIDSTGSYNFAADIGAQSANIALIVQSGGSATFSASQHLAGLTVSGNAAITPGDGVVIVTSDLQVPGKLDIADGAIVVDYTGASPIGTYNNNSYTGISGMIASGRNGGSWDGASGIVTSKSDAQGANALTTVGVAESSAALSLTSGHTTVWLGQTVDDTAVLIRYTYAGDANLSGTITGDDYFMIDSGFAAQGSTYGNGDFDQNGHINADDYFIIDSNYSKALAPMASAPPLNLAPSMRSDLFGTTTIDATDSPLIDELL